ncbi:MAG: dihydrofolate reductase [Gammaproteobacteria bacterium]|nr:dihydrofolate reductase [Gammaproteobacteria bacterium]
MAINIIVAMAEHRVIGRGGTLPWHLPADLGRFKQITMGHRIVMGRLTYESIGRPLPGRTSIVVTTRANYQAPGCVVSDSFDAALNAASDKTEIMVIGGHALYQVALPVAQRIYLTEIDAEIDGDVYFPEFDRTVWRETSREAHSCDAAHLYSYSFVVLERVMA